MSSLGHRGCRSPRAASASGFAGRWEGAARPWAAGPAPSSLWPTPASSPQWPTWARSRVMPRCPSTAPGDETGSGPAGHTATALACQGQRSTPPCAAYMACACPCVPGRAPFGAGAVSWPPARFALRPPRFQALYEAITRLGGTANRAGQWPTLCLANPPGDVRLVPAQGVAPRAVISLPLAASGPPPRGAPWLANRCASMSPGRL
jgi:hypothetical protein